MAGRQPRTAKAELPAGRTAAKETPARKKAKRQAAKRGKGGRNGTVRQLREAREAGEDITGSRATVHLGKTNTAILTGQEDLSTWDEEELIRGQKRSANGKFVGRPPAVVPKPIHDELVKRTLSKAGEVLRSNLVAGVEALGEIAKDPDAPEAARIRAIEIIMDRTMGKAPDRVEISADMPWLDALTDSIVATEEDFVEVLEADSWEAEGAR